MRSITCSRCGREIDARQPQCMWCGAPRPSFGARVRDMLRGGLDAGFVVQGIIAANVVFYLLSLLVSGRRGFDMNPLSFLSPDQNSLLLLGATGTIPVLELGRVWSLISANYLHGGLLHILFNMMALRQIGPWVSAEFGASRMFVIYTLSGVAGYVASFFAGIPFTIGASASVCGLIGALYYFGKSRGGNYGAAVSREVSGWLISLVLFGLIMPGINNWGHGGGVVGGVVLAKLLGYQEGSRENSAHRLLALICLVATVAVLCYAAYFSLAYRFS
ncbi:rhomboid family intramembrane serine protease [Citrifermentans bremense]|uniref:Rhomboid family intramembrane serine protease n=2 Tax=Citrifermentans bremense TaxID=60035 RepID=A0A6S6LXY7_9BACT|nr:rhomboid family intramembrane serine protease [Citrifermentans bremense]